MFEIRSNPEADVTTFLLEVTMGERTKRVIEKMERYLQAFQSGILHRLYAHNYPPKILWLFEKPQNLKAVIQRCHELPFLHAYAPLFLFSTMAQTEADILNRW